MAKSEKSIVLFTINYPYNFMEHSFLKDELKYLKNHFSKVYIIPEKIVGKLNKIPEQIVVNESFASSLKVISYRHKLKALFSWSLIKELVKIKFNLKKTKYAIATCISGIIARDWITSFVNERPNEEIILYSFWFDFSTLGFSSVKRNFPNIKIVSRCHNFDLYGNEHNGFYVPFQSQVIPLLNGIYPDSFHGELFVKEKYPSAKCKSEIMGVSDPKTDNLASNDGVVRILSCAYMIPRKRVHLMMDALIFLSKTQPDLAIEWTHIGEGTEWDMITRKSDKLEGKYSANFLGNISNIELHSYYQKKPVDLFINTSTLEGTPVSIMEAISYGIPILATAFGGNKEIIEFGAGALLTTDPTFEEIADKLLNLIKENRLDGLRKKAKEVWRENYNSDKNYINFCHRIDKL